MSELHIFADSDGQCREAAQRILRAGQKAVAEEGRFVLLLSGGQTPRRLYALLGSPEYRGRLEWTRTHLFWGDERAVPLSDPQSNYRMVSETLLSRIQIPEENIHRLRTELPSEEAAVSYERELQEFFAGPPGFHLALLGMGADGHTASLFPGSPALHERKRLVVATMQGNMRRISLTLAALNAAREVLFLVAEAAKAPVLAAVLEGPPDPDLPAALVRPASGQLVWLVDRAAAEGLEQQLQER